MKAGRSARAPFYCRLALQKIVSPLDRVENSGTVGEGGAVTIIESSSRLPFKHPRL
jgi:hypothetical protein